ncbi:MAG TPA: hypothetical protein VFP61_14225, partial [Acidimicrobiales bacterium]|nr:hypothetical protein [Acidimicrobiales bacterium]
MEAPIVLIMMGCADPPTSTGESQLRESAAGGFEPTEVTERAAERLALGNALEERADDIVRWCQLADMKQSGATLEEVAALR